MTRSNSLAPHIWLRRSLLLVNAGAPIALLATGFGIWWVVVGAAVAHAALLKALLAPGCAWLGPVATRFRAAGREVWLTIDDGPFGEETGALSDELRDRGVPATFFLKGRHLVAQPAIAARLHAAGHTLANHTHTHPAGHFWWLLPTALRRELDGCDAALAGACVTVRRWFRAPVGLKHILLHRELATRGLRLIGWTVRGRDGVATDPERVVRRILRHVRPGAIILLHEGRPRSREAIRRVVAELQARGYRFVIPSDAQLR